jgi:hypothetical protein
VTAAPRLLRAAAVVVVALAGLALALWFFTAQDDATTRAPDAVVPGTAAADPRPWSADLRQGNLLVETATRADQSAVQRLAADVAGSPPVTADLLAAGQAIRVVRVEGPLDAPVIAYAHDRALAVDSSDDPRLEQFLTYWLGRGGG